MITTRAIAIFSLLGLAACNSQDTGDQPSVSEVQQRVLPSDSEILLAVYDNRYQTPDNFYVDEHANTTESYSLYHVKDPSVSYELCTDDYQQALAWEVSDNERRQVNGVYVDSYENDRYFEFVRELSSPDDIGNIGDLTSPGYSRVFKCSYVNRDGVDRNLRDGYAGTLNVRPLSKDVIRDFAEYMWQFTFFWPAQKTVLNSFSDDRIDTYQHTLVLGFITSQGYDRCDLIEVVDWVFTVDKNDGQVTKDFTRLYQFEAQLISGLPEKCS